jgi:HEAT repeat protein
MINRRNSSTILRKNPNQKPTKWAQGIVVWTEKRTVWVLDNNQSNHNHNNKNLIQYDFPFASGVSQLWTTERGYIQEQLWDAAVKARIYCIRHGMSVQEKEGKKLQTADTPLCEDAKKQYKENAEKLKRFWVRSENTYLLYCEVTEEGKVVRIAESAGLIAEGVWIPPERILKTMSWLDTTDKDDDVVNRRISITKSISIDFAAQLLAKIWSNTVWNINIICIIHKSNIEGIQEGIFQNKDDRESHLPKMDKIETGEITCIDVDRAWQPLNYKRRYDVLRIDAGNYESILNILKWEVKLQNIISLFEAQKIQIWELQNYVNGYFQENKELYERYLYSTSKNLKIFCIMHLIQEWKKEVLNKFFQTEDLDTSRLWQPNNIQRAIIDYYKNVYKNVLMVRDKSLDIRINNGEDINPHFNFSNEEYKEILNLITVWKPIKYIEWKAWAGKSFLLVNLAEKINTLNLENINKPEVKPYYSLYINLSQDRIEKLQRDLEQIWNKDSYEIVFLIDSIDESDIRWEKRKELDAILLQLSKSGKVIITSRNGYLYDYKGNWKEEKDQKDNLEQSQEIIEIKDLEEHAIKDFIKKYFDNNEKKENQVLIILEKLKWAWNNPLLLCMICEIVKKWKIEDKDTEELTIIEIYKSIVDLRLKDYNNTKQASTKIGNEKFYKMVLRWLEEIWYSQLIKSIKLQDIFEYIPIPNDEMINSLNLLFRKNNDTKEYNFVHQSFKEYFAGKYIFEAMKKPNFDFENFLCRVLKQIDLNLLDMLCEFIKTDENTKKLFLEKIDENESYYAIDIQPSIVYLLSLLNNDRKREYLKYINITKPIIQILWQVGWLENEQFIRNQMENDNTEVQSQIIASLWQIGWLENEQFIRNQMENDNTVVQSQIIASLWQIGWLENEQFIRNQMRSVYFVLQIQIIALLWQIGWPENEQFIRNQMRGVDSEVQRQIIKSLSKIGWPENEQFIRDQMRNVDTKVQCDIIESLSKIGWLENEQFIYDQIVNFEYLYWSVQRQILESLWQIGWPENEQFIRNQIWGIYNNAKRQIIKSLSKIGWPENEQFIRDQMKSVAPQVQFEIIKSLWQIGWPENEQFIRDQIGSNSTEVQSQIIESFARMGWQENEQFIRNQMRSVDAEVQSQIIASLWEIGWPENEQFIRDQMRSVDARVQSQIIASLWQIGWPENEQFIRNQMRGVDSEVQRQIIKSLSKIGWPENEQFIRDQMRNVNPEVQRHIIESLSKIGWPENEQFIRDQFRKWNYVIIKQDKWNFIRVHTWIMIIVQLREWWWKENIECIKELVRKGKNPEFISKCFNMLKLIWWRKNRDFIAQQRRK